MDKIDPVLNRDLTAAYLSVLPGLGHLCKHPCRSGLTILTLGNIVAGLFTGPVAFANLGAARIVLPALWIAGVAYDAWCGPDLSHNSKPA